MTFILLLTGTKPYSIEDFLNFRADTARLQQEVGKYKLCSCESKLYANIVQLCIF